MSNKYLLVMLVLLQSSCYSSPNQFSYEPDVDNWADITFSIEDKELIFSVPGTPSYDVPRPQFIDWDPELSPFRSGERYINDFFSDLWEYYGGPGKGSLGGFSFSARLLKKDYMQNIYCKDIFLEDWAKTHADFIVANNANLERQGLHDDITELPTNYGIVTIDSLEAYYVEDADEWGMTFMLPVESGIALVFNWHLFDGNINKPGRYDWVEPAKNVAAGIIEKIKLNGNWEPIKQCL